MTKKEVAAKLREALRLMNDNGAHWIKGEYAEDIEYDENGDSVEVAYCSLGAIRYVTGTDLWTGSNESNVVAFALADALPPVEFPPEYAAMTPEQGAFDKIVTWNDDEDREWNEVVEAFTKAADQLEQS